MPLDAITAIDRKKWKSKGIAYAIYTENGKEKRLCLDEHKFKGAEAIILEAERRIKAREGDDSASDAPGNDARILASETIAGNPRARIPTRTNHAGGGNITQQPQADKLSVNQTSRDRIGAPISSASRSRSPEEMSLPFQLPSSRFKTSSGSPADLAKANFFEKEATASFCCSIRTRSPSIARIKLALLTRSNRRHGSPRVHWPQPLPSPDRDA